MVCRLINSAMPKIKHSTRFKKGSQVEVFYCGNWRPAKIVWGNGRTYIVQYNHCHFSSSSGSNTSEVVYADRVPRKALRPLPPVKEKANEWAPGDMVEVLVHGSWKPAKVTGVAYGKEYYFVSLLDNCRELAIKKLNLRKQRKWENGKWVTIKKDSGNGTDSKKRKLSSEVFDEICKKQRISQKKKKPYAWRRKREREKWRERHISLSWMPTMLPLLHYTLTGVLPGNRS
ncbi:uncharacterized protein LOC144571838 isoform X2 [Carex rostrata]